jgi:PAS domain S-box-containing protein
MQHARKLFQAHQLRNWCQTDRLFACLLVFEWLAGIATAYFISPRAWSGETSQVHIHVWAAVVLGATIVSLPVFFAMKNPGQALTRHSVATAQMLMSALFIHLSGGRIETHFFIFGSLAFLSFYRDWRVLITASVVVAVDHAIRGTFWPQSVYGVLTASPLRWVEHAGWVVFEDIFLIRSCLLSTRETWDIALNQAKLESTNATIEQTVAKRTAELRMSEERFRLLTARAPVCIYQTDAGGETVYVNPRWQEISGLSPEDSLGLGWSRAIHPADRDRTVSAFQEACQANKELSLNYRVVRPNGEIRFVVSHAAPVLSPDGTFAGYVGMAEDITKLLEVERLKQEFVSTVSHELRTPLTSIVGSLTLASSGVLGELPPEVSEIVCVAERNAKRLITLINDILDLERLDSGNLDMRFDSVPVRDILHRSVEAVQAFADDSQIDLVVASPPVLVVGDGDRLVQLTVNLLANAIKFSPPGSKVVLSAMECSDFLEIRVTDQGRGIPESHRTAIFERFRQVDASDSRQKGGSGLGLAICKAIVEQHGGSIGVISEEGAGSTFWFRLPATGAPQEPPNAEDPGHRASDNGKRSAEGKPAVMVVDDEELHVELVVRELSHPDLSIRTVKSGNEALRQMSDNPPELLVLDIGMPDGDGFEVVEAMRRSERLKDIPLVVYTCRDVTRSQRQQLQLGPTVFLTKTKATGQELRNAVMHLLRHSREQACLHEEVSQPVPDPASGRRTG